MRLPADWCILKGRERSFFAGGNVMFETENAFYNAHKQEFREKYLNKSIVIQNETLKGVYDTDAEAYAGATRTMKPGTFAIKVVAPTDADEIAHFTSRVYA